MRRSVSLQIRVQGLLQVQRALPLLRADAEKPRFAQNPVVRGAAPLLFSAVGCGADPQDVQARVRRKKGRPLSARFRFHTRGHFQKLLCRPGIQQQNFDKLQDGKGCVRPEERRGGHFYKSRRRRKARGGILPRHVVESDTSPFYCVEPWMGAPNSAANPKHFVAPGASKTFLSEISLF